MLKYNTLKCVLFFKDKICFVCSEQLWFS